MYAIIPGEVGKRVGWRKIREGWPLTGDEQFAVDSLPENPVLAEDGQSLRSMTQDELEAEKQEEKKQERKEQIDRELEAIDKATIRAIRAARVAERNGESPDTRDLDRIEELENVAVSLRQQRNSGEEIQWPEWRR